MSDLISRSEVNDVIDELEVYTSGRPNTMKVEVSVLQLQRFINKLKNIPTAYDVDKVVATMDKALIELEDGTNCGTCAFKAVCDDGYDGCIQTIVAVCKSIVKAGGNS